MWSEKDNNDGINIDIGDGGDCWCLFADRGQC
jgi:hypothetical protein